MIDWITGQAITRKQIRAEMRIVRKRIKQAKDELSRTAYVGRFGKLAAMLKQTR